MSNYRAVYLRRDADTDERHACHARPLSGATIQSAIDEASTHVTPCSDVTSIDIFDGDDKVETVGVGVDPART